MFGIMPAYLKNKGSIIKRRRQGNISGSGVSSQSMFWGRNNHKNNGVCKFDLPMPCRGGCLRSRPRLRFLVFVLMPCTTANITTHLDREHIKGFRVLSMPHTKNAWIRVKTEDSQIQSWLFIKSV